MAKFILRRATNDSERGKYEYYQSCSEQGVVMLTQSKEHATVFNYGEEFRIENASSGAEQWQPIRYRKRVFNAKKVIYKAKSNQTK
jgi:hypothetical protein